MIARFSLYGFLKNQRYFEPFIILFFLDKGLSFTQIGILIGFRELAINFMETPSGAVADLFGRRRSMMLSFVCYITSFAVFGFSQAYWHLFIAMFFFAVGEAFRTGTHKAMIFTWLRNRGRTDEKTQVYGYTRSWAQIGSAVSVVLAVVFVFWTNTYSYVFFFAIVPYFLGLVNFMFYPKELEGQPEEGADLRSVLRHLWGCLRDSVCVRHMRRLMVESMGFEGIYKAVEDYIQPVVKSLALAIPLFMWMSDQRRSAILIGIVYVIIYLAAAWASRNAHRLSKFAGGEEGGSRLLWWVVLVLYLGLIPLLYFQYYYVAVAGFIVLALIQNLWGPMIVSRFDAFATESRGATVLSIRSQAKAVSTMIIAPIFGVAVDFIRGNAIGGDFWPVAAIAALVTLAILATPLRRDA